MDVAEFKSELGSILHDSSNEEYTEADILRWLNRGQKYAAMKLGLQHRIFSDSGVVGQAEYTWPASALKILGANYNWENPLTPTSVKDLRYYDEDWLQAHTITIPTHYRLVEKSRKVAIYPPPSSAADTTAIDDSDDITASDTMIMVDSVSGFPTRGRIIIGTEVIGYTNTVSITALATTHRARTSNVATITTAKVHGFAVGDNVLVSDMTDGDYDGNTVVVAVPTTTTFTYSNTGDDEASTADTAGSITRVTFTGCTRGLEDTTAATHADDATVTLRDIAFWCVEAPDALTATTDEPWDGLTYLEPFHGVLIPYCLYMAKMKEGEPEEAKNFYRQWLIELDDMRKELNKLMPERVYQYVPQEPKEWPPRHGYVLPIEE